MRKLLILLMLAASLVLSVGPCQASPGTDECMDLLQQLHRIMRYADDSRWADDSSGVLVWRTSFTLTKNCMKQLKDAGFDDCLTKAMESLNSK